MKPFIFVLVAACFSRSSAAAAEELCTPNVSSAPRVPQPSSSCILTDAVLQMQRDKIDSINEVAKELKEIKHVLSDISFTLKDMLSILVSVFIPCVLTSYASHPHTGTQ